VLADGIAVAHPDMLEQLGTALAMSSLRGPPSASIS
jgi:hypothetical protein